MKAEGRARVAKPDARAIISFHPFKKAKSLFEIIADDVVLTLASSCCERLIGRPVFATPASVDCKSVLIEVVDV